MNVRSVPDGPAETTELPNKAIKGGQGCSPLKIPRIKALADLLKSTDLALDGLKGAEDKVLK